MYITITAIELIEYHIVYKLKVFRISVYTNVMYILSRYYLYFIECRSQIYIYVCLRKRNRNICSHSSQTSYF